MGASRLWSFSLTIRLIRNPPRLLKDIAANILKLETLIKRKKISEIEKRSRYY